MCSLEPKKLIILRILDILTEYSDAEHKLKQKDIISLLNINYGIECERKAVARNISYLIDAGYDIVTESDGVYLAEKRFEVGELRLLIDSVLSNRNICKDYTIQLTDKLCKEGGKYFKSYAKHVVNLDDWQKRESRDYFYNIEILCEAIEKKKQVSFFTNTYGTDKKLHHKRQEKTIANPYQLILKNGYYYLVCNYDNCDNGIFCRVDRLTDVQILSSKFKPYTKVLNFKNGINLGKIANKLPYMFDDKIEQVVFESRNNVDDTILNNVLDWFGTDVKIEKIETGYRFSLYASPSAMRFWILQFGKFVKVIKPQSLQDAIKSDILEMQKLYKE